MQALNIFYVLIAIAMVALILVQKGAGATAGAAFGSGASGTVFGARGAGNFLTRSTWVLATLFCSLSLLMAVMVSRMSNAPETDLGVLSTSPEVSETVEVEITDPALTIPDENVAAPSTMENAGQSETAGDVPENTGAGAESVEDLPAVEGNGVAPANSGEDDTAPGAESDGS
jgi:preprotein translocase subunit SecG